MLDVSLKEVQAAMTWFKSLSTAELLGYRKKIPRPDALSIARYWKANIKK